MPAPASGDGVGISPVDRYNGRMSWGEYEVTIADRQTGKESVLRIDANSCEDAINRAIDAGFIVGKARRLRAQSASDPAPAVSRRDGVCDNASTERTKEFQREALIGLLAVAPFILLFFYYRSATSEWFGDGYRSMAGPQFDVQDPSGGLTSAQVYYWVQGRYEYYDSVSIGGAEADSRVIADAAEHFGIPKQKVEDLYFSFEYP